MAFGLSIGVKRPEDQPQSILVAVAFVRARERAPRDVEKRCQGLAAFGTGDYHSVSAEP
jgi:hypothetical protein